MDQRIENLNPEEIALLTEIFKLLPGMEGNMEVILTLGAAARFNECIGNLGKMIEAFEEMERVIFPMLNNLQAPRYMKKHDRLKRVFTEVVDAYEENHGSGVYRLVKNSLYPAFFSWKQELREIEQILLNNNS